MYRSIAHPWIEYQCVGPTIRPSCNPRPSIQPHSYVSFFFLFLFSISNLQHVSKKRHCNNGGEKKKRSEKPVWISKRGGPRVSTRDRKSSNQQGILITLAPLFEFERTIDPKKREREAAGQKMCVYPSWFHTNRRRYPCWMCLYYSSLKSILAPRRMDGSLIHMFIRRGVGALINRDSRCLLNVDSKTLEKFY